MTTVFTGRIRPFAPSTDIEVEAMAVDDATIVAVGSAEEIRRTYPDAKMVALDGWVMPGLIEPHGHPGFATILLSDLVVDLRPVVVPRAEDVVAALRTAVAEADGEPVFANGWDSLLQRGLPDPDIRFLDDLAGRVPLVVIHNSGHSVYFNTAAALAAGIDRTTPDPVGASFGRDAEGELTGVALEAAAVEMVVAPMLATAQEHLPRILPAHLRDLAARGITTVSDLSWNRGLDPLIDALRAKGAMPVRLRWYEMSRPGGMPSARGGGDAFFRQTGVKTWSDGSPWVGNIATSFPYLDTRRPVRSDSSPTTSGGRTTPRTSSRPSPSPMPPRAGSWPVTRTGTARSMRPSTSTRRSSRGTDSPIIASGWSTAAP